MSALNQINWEDVKLQLATSQKRLEEVFAPKDNSVKRLLADRAAKYANREKQSNVSSPYLSILILKVGNHLLGLESSDVWEVARFSASAAVPEAFDSLLGVINVHNDLYCLLNPYYYLNETTSEPPAFTQAVVLRHLHLKIAIGCDELLGLESIPQTSLQDNRVFKLGSQFGILLDVKAILNPLEGRATV